MHEGIGAYREVEVKWGQKWILPAPSEQQKFKQHIPGGEPCFCNFESPRVRESIPNVRGKCEVMKVKWKVTAVAVWPVAGHMTYGMRTSAGFSGWSLEH